MRFPVTNNNQRMFSFQVNNNHQKNKKQKTNNKNYRRHLNVIQAVRELDPKYRLKDQRQKGRIKRCHSYL